MWITAKHRNCPLVPRPLFSSRRSHRRPCAYQALGVALQGAASVLLVVDTAVHEADRSEASERRNALRSRRKPSLHEAICDAAPTLGRLSKPDGVVDCGGSRRPVSAGTAGSTDSGRRASRMPQFSRPRAADSLRMTVPHFPFERRATPCDPTESWCVGSTLTSSAVSGFLVCIMAMSVLGERHLALAEHSRWSGSLHLLMCPVKRLADMHACN